MLNRGLIIEKTTFFTVIQNYWDMIIITEGVYAPKFIFFLHLTIRKSSFSSVITIKNIDLFFHRLPSIVEASPASPTSLPPLAAPPSLSSSLSPPPACPPQSTSQSPESPSPSANSAQSRSSKKLKWKGKFCNIL